MTISKISRKKIYFAAALVIIVVFAAFLWRDFNLYGKISVVKLPDVVVQNIEIDREINGKRWKLISPRVEHKDGIFYGVSLDITITEDDGKVTRIKAESGVFTRSSNDISMVSADAVMREKEEEFKLTAGGVEFEAATEFWSFSDNVTLSDGKLTVNGKEGSYDTKSGLCTVKGGGTVTWKE